MMTQARAAARIVSGPAILTAVVFGSMAGCSTVMPDGKRLWYAHPVPATVVRKLTDDEWDGISPEGSPEVRDREGAMWLLLNTDMFPTGAWQPEGITPVQWEAFRVILRQPDAPAAFAYLMEHGRPAGRLTALCGLYLVDHAAYERAMPKLRGSKAKVQAPAGDVVYDASVSEIVCSRHKDALHPRPGQTLKELDWQRSHPTPDTWRNYTRVYDIVGGAYPYLFAGYRGLLGATTELPKSMFE